ncbi:MAG: hypothetical protein SFV22_19850 [Saprospiraceae bacterium]|nr:hypothetical protein [Saprospiraceae bacterium]
MKFHTATFAFFCSLLLSSCDKTYPLPTIEELGYWGSASAIRNNMSWTGAPISVAIDNDYQGKGFQISIDSLDKYGIPQESLTFSKVPFQPGKSYLFDTYQQTDDGLVGAHYFILDDDVLIGSYKVVEDSTSFITLTSYDSTSRELKGIFEATFVVEHRPDPTYPDTIRFRNGHFHTRLKD